MTVEYFVMGSSELPAATAYAPKDDLGVPQLGVRYSLDRTQVITAADWTPDDTQVPGLNLGDASGAMLYIAEHYSDWNSPPSDE